MKHTTRNLVIAAAFLLYGTTAVNAKTDVTGMWLTCLSKEMGGQKNPFELLRIRYDKQRIVWTSEWGVGFSASGRGFRHNDGLNLVGCHYQNGKIMGACNVKNPPRHLSLDAAFFKAPKTASDTTLALKNGHPILTSAKKWEPLAAACEALVVATPLPAPTPRMATPTAASLKEKAVTSTVPSPPANTGYRVNTAFPAYR